MFLNCFDWKNLAGQAQEVQAPNRFIDDRHMCHCVRAWTCPSEQALWPPNEELHRATCTAKTRAN